MTHDAMPGMAPRAEVNRLRDVRGVDADREFLGLMIAHRRGGVAMAEATLRRTDQAEVVALASPIVATYASEIPADGRSVGRSDQGHHPSELNAAPTHRSPSDSAQGGKALV